MSSDSIGFTIAIRVETPTGAGAFSALSSAIWDAGGSLEAIDVHSLTKTHATRDVTVAVPSEKVGEAVQKSLERLPGTRVLSASDNTFLAHLGGKIHIEGNVPVKTRQDLSTVYTPGVARVSMALARDASKAFQFTIKRNMVAVVSDGTAVLGLGDIGPYGAAPVMEGKCMLFKQFGNVDAFPICLNTKDTDEIVDTVIRISPIFGGVNLEDISAPRCFDVEERLIEALDIPVMHDDQHGTAVVTMAAFFNAAAVVGKKLADMRVVVAGAGAAGIATIKMLMLAGIGDVVAADRSGAIARSARYDNPHKTWLAQNTNRDNRTGSLSEVLKGADAFIGVSGPGLIHGPDVKAMGRDPIVLAMANPMPEIMPEEAAPYVAVMATGRSDYPNQVNNVLAFPGIFRGALDCRARRITDGMKMAAAKAIAAVVGNERAPEYIIPSVFDPRICETVSKAVMAAAIQEGVARDTSVAEEERIPVGV